MIMPIELAGVEAKLARAEEHFRVLTKDVSEKLEECPFSFDQVRDADFTDLSLVLRTNDFRFPFLWWSLLVGDFVHNLRSALDHLVYLIAVHESRREPPPNEHRLAFIIEDQSEGFKRRANSALRGLSDKAQSAMEAVQPFNRRRPDIPSPLLILKSLSNQDKHPMIRLKAATPALWDFDFRPLPRGAVSREYRWSADNLEDGVEIAGIHSSEPEPELAADGRLGICVPSCMGLCPLEMIREQTELKPYSFAGF